MSELSLSVAGKQQYCDKAIKLEEVGRAMYLTLGEMLYNIRRDRLYEGSWSSWQEYCMEFKDISSSSASKLITVYEIMVLKYGFTIEELAKAGGWTKLYQIAAASPTKKVAASLLKDAETLTRKDLEKNLKELKTGIDMRTCKHENAFTVRICPDCGDRHRVYEEYDSSSDECCE